MSALGLHIRVLNNVHVLFVQGAALVHIYKDGSVLLSHGGIEMGQGLHTKMVQVSFILGCVFNALNRSIIIRHIGCVAQFGQAPAELCRFGIDGAHLFEVSKKLEKIIFLFIVITAHCFLSIR